MSDSNTDNAFLRELLAAGLLLDSGVPGIPGRSGIFEDVLERLNALITISAKSDGAEVVRFPPTINRKHFEASEFLKSFPQLAGSVFSFEGTQQEHMALLDAVHDGKDWTQYQKMTDVVLAPAACYPIYPLTASRGALPKGGRLYDVFSYCFRHEPSPDPARMQMFRMREFVRVCPPDDAVPWRDLWLERGLAMLKSLGLPVASDVANDPFFGRGGKLLAVNQREQKLKFEVLMPIASPSPTAIMSFNYHQDHFGTIFGIKTEDGAIAHTACVGFGMERIVLGLFKTHGFDVAKWPSEVRARLWP